MATEAPSFDDLEEPTETATDDGVRVLDLEPGDSIVARLRLAERNVGQHDRMLLHLTTKDGEPIKFWSPGSVAGAISAEDPTPEDWIGLRRLEDERSFEDDDGEEVTYHPVEVRFPGGDD